VGLSEERRKINIVDLVNVNRLASLLKEKSLIGDLLDQFILRSKKESARVFNASQLCLHKLSLLLI
jgi:hypothetical protein